MMQPLTPSQSELLSLDGRVAVITGGARGIGAGIAARLAEAGATVVIGDIEEKVARSLTDTLSLLYARPAYAQHLDVSDSASVAAIADWTTAKTGRCDIWVNNAGIYGFRALSELRDEEWDRVDRVNLRGTFIGCREAARQMKCCGNAGVILNIASTAGLRGFAELSHYAASKHGVVGITKSLAKELGPSGIRVVAIAPTLINTPGIATRDGRMFDPNDAAALDENAKALPLGRVGHVDDVARVALFCVSDMAALVTGAVIPVDAGALA